MGIQMTMHRTTKLTIGRDEYDTFNTVTIKGGNSTGDEVQMLFFTDNRNLELEVEEEE